MTYRFAIFIVLAFSYWLGAFDMQARAQGPINHLIYPVKTDLQRELTPTGTTLFVLIDTTELLKDNPVALNSGLRKSLLSHKAADTQLHFQLFVPWNPPGQRRDPNLRYALIGFGHETGFTKVTASLLHMNTEITWNKYVASFASKPGQTVGDEPPLVGMGVKVYPVRTELSRCLSSGADCVVMIEPVLIKKPEKLQAELGNLIGQLKLPQKKRVTFDLSQVPDKERQNMNKLAELIGFEASTVMIR